MKNPPSIKSLARECVARSFALVSAMRDLEIEIRQFIDRTRQLEASGKLIAASYFLEAFSEAAHASESCPRRAKREKSHLKIVTNKESHAQPSKTPTDQTVHLSNPER